MLLLALTQSLARPASVELAHGLLQASLGDVEVRIGRLDVGVPEHFLDEVNWPASLYQSRTGFMAKIVDTQVDLVGPGERLRIQSRAVPT